MKAIVTCDLIEVRSSWDALLELRITEQHLSGGNFGAVAKSRIKYTLDYRKGQPVVIYRICLSEQGCLSSEKATNVTIDILGAFIFTLLV
jgi:hypothetical protein